MFELKSNISRTSRLDLDDVSNIKSALTVLGEYDDTETGLAPYTDEQLFGSIKNFQGKENLKVDGVINKDGPTQQKIKTRLAENKKTGNAFSDFKRNFDQMNEAKTDGADKYFHCMANYQATERGWSGELVAKGLSEAKELKDMYWTGHPKEDSDKDQKANRHGRKAAKSGSFKTAREACSISRPKALDDKY